MNTRHIICLLAAAAVLSGPARAQLQPGDETVGPGATATDVIPPWQMEFENLSLEARRDYGSILGDAARLFGQKRIFEALNRIADADEIFPDNPVALNLKGACYVEFRDFEKAREVFSLAFDKQKVVLSDIENLPDEKRYARMASVADILFNIAEMDFVTNNWQRAHDQFADLLKNINPAKEQMIRLIELKLLIAKIKLGRMEEARTLAAKYDYLDDSPFYYYAKAALAYHEGDVETAERARATARRVFQKPGMLAAWEDTMIEADYLKSFYGGDLAVDPTEVPVPE
ncbi:MAG: hypothetical protein HKN82_09940 [Akkermansiaceae bacterium]|nr:hypothetical protein [Akkermansiaceae bacterium]